MCQSTAKVKNRSINETQSRLCLVYETRIATLASIVVERGTIPGRPFQDLLVFTRRLPDNTVLTVGQETSEESKIRHALKRMLFWRGAARAAIGLVLSVLLARGALKRVNGMVTAAWAVAVGQMQVRAPTRPPS